MVGVASGGVVVAVVAVWDHGEYRLRTRRLVVAWLLGWVREQDERGNAVNRRHL